MMKMFLFVFLFVTQAFAAEGPFLNGVKSEEKSGKINLHFQLSQAIEIDNVQAHFLRRTVEWDLKGLNIKKDKIFHTVAMSGINNVYVSQTEDKTVRIRVNLDEGLQASAFADRLSFQQEGSSLTLSINTAVALAAGNSKEMNKSYAVGDGIEWSVNNTLKVSAKAADAPKSVPPAAVAAKVSEEVPAATSIEDEIAITPVIIDDNKSENEIPLNTPKAADSSVTTASASRMAIGFVAVVLLGLSVFLVGKKINSKRLSAPFNHDSIKVVSQKYLGPKRNLTLVRVAGEYMLLGVTDHNISLIKTLAVVDDEIPELSPGDFGKAIKNLTQKQEPALSAADMAADEIEDSFSVSNLSDVKNLMRKRKYIDETDF